MTDALDALFTVPPEQFMEARKAVVAKLKAEGLGDASKEALAAKKPTKVAYLLNRLAREHSESVAGLAEIAKHLTQAHGADALREAIAEQRKAVAALTASASSLGASAQELSVISTVLFGATTSADRAAELALGRFSKAPQATASFLGDVNSVGPAKPIVVETSKRGVREHDEGTGEAVSSKAMAAKAAAAAAVARKKREQQVSQARAAAEVAANKANHARDTADKLDTEATAAEKTVIELEKELASRKKKAADAREAAEDARAKADALEQDSEGLSAEAKALAQESEARNAQQEKIESGHI